MHQDLLDQAKDLAKLDKKGKPKQANLRRALSSAYYGLFHFLVEESCCAILGTQLKRRGYRDSLARAFVHTTMKNACASFEGTQLPATVVKSLPMNAQGHYVIAKPIQNIAATFTELQQKRHFADYDRFERFTRSEVLTLINQAETHVKDFKQLSQSDGRRFFLVCLLAWKEMSNR